MKRIELRLPQDVADDLLALAGSRNRQSDFVIRLIREAALQRTPMARAEALADEVARLAAEVDTLRTELVHRSTPPT